MKVQNSEGMEAAGDVLLESPVDMGALEEIFGDNVDAQLNILKKFVAQMEEILATIETAYAQRDAAQVKFQAHKLKSSARTVGANRLADICLALEAAGRDADWTRIAPQLRDMQSEVARVTEFVASL